MRFRQLKPFRKETKKPIRKPSSYQPIVPAVDQAARILLYLGNNSGSKRSLSEISREVGIHKSKGFSILNTLNKFGFVEKDFQTKTYSLGTGLLSLSRNVLDHMSYPEMVAPFLQHLAIETNGTALFGLINGEHLFVVGKHEGNQNIGFTVRLGHKFHLTLGAHGKAILAFMPEAERERILKRKKVYFYWDPADVDRKLLRDELTRCREQGFSQDIGKITPGVNVVSSPVFGLREKMVGCIILIGTFAETKIVEYGPKVTGIARQISQKLGADVETIYPRKPLRVGRQEA